MFNQRTDAFIYHTKSYDISTYCSITGQEEDKKPAASLKFIEFLIAVSLITTRLSVRAFNFVFSNFQRAHFKLKRPPESVANCYITGGICATKCIGSTTRGKIIGVISTGASNLSRGELRDKTGCSSRGEQSVVSAMDPRDNDAFTLCIYTRIIKDRRDGRAYCIISSPR